MRRLQAEEETTPVVDDVVEEEAGPSMVEIAEVSLEQIAVYMGWAAELCQAAYYIMSGAAPWDTAYLAQWIDLAPSLLLVGQQILAEFNLTDYYFLDQRQYLLLYMFVA